MSGFKGKYEHSIDDKGRVNFPVKLKKYLSPESLDTFVITRGHNNCLYLYTIDEWNKVEQQLQATLNVNRDQDRLYLRTLLMNTHEVTMDRQSRISIPDSLLQLARIDGAVLIIGALEHIEIWSPAVFEEYLKNNAGETFENVAFSTMGGG